MGSISFTNDLAHCLPIPFRAVQALSESWPQEFLRRKGVLGGLEWHEVSLPRIFAAPHVPSIYTHRDAQRV